MAGAKDSATSIPRKAAAGEPRCSLCGTHLISRMKRQGFVERWIYPLFGYYPWRCSVCRTKIFLRKRSRPGENGKQYAE